MNHKYSSHTIYTQRGTIALLISLVILTLITFVSLYTAKTVSVEQKISGNEYRSRVAFEAAEAGMEAAMTYIDRSNGGPDRNATGTLSDENIFATDDDTSADYGTVQIGPPDGDEINWKLLDNNSKTVVQLDGTVTKDGITVDITSLGISGDGSAQRTIKKTASVIDPLPGFPNVPFSARGAVTVQGAVKVYNPEGNSTIRTGGVFGWTSAGAETNIADPAHDNYPECLGGSNECIGVYAGLEGCPGTNYVKCDLIKVSDNNTYNIDIDQNFLGFKNATANEFFINMFGQTKTYFRAKRVDRFVDYLDFGELYTDGGVHRAHGEVLWVDVPSGEVLDIGGIDAGCQFTNLGAAGPNSKSDAFDENCTVAGGVLDPIILVINGDVNINASPIFYGMIYITGDITGAGNPEVQGALAQEQPTANVNMTGSLSIWYDSAILEMTSGNGPFATASGTWKDF